jgi:bacterioferritin-associated ferredoxin
VIVCHCNIITEKAIRDIVDELVDADRFQVITPGLVYLTLGKRGRCCGCFPNAIEVIRSQVDIRRGVEVADADADDDAAAA